MMPETFPARLTALRVSRKLTITQLADRAGLTRQGVHLIENGQRRPTLDTLGKLAKALRVKLIKLV